MSKLVSLVLALGLAWVLTPGCGDRTVDPSAVVDRGVDGALDALADTAVARDAGQVPDGATTFPQLLDGFWLIGYWQSTSRFSWVRFEGATAGGGPAVIGSVTPSGWTTLYWSCSGPTTWFVTSTPDTFQLNYPSSMCTGMKSETFTFTKVKAANSNDYPKGAVLEAWITAHGSSPSEIRGYKFPPDLCDVAMTACKAPMP